MDIVSYLGSGRIYLRERGTADPLLPVGNCSALNFAFEEDKKTLPDHQNPGGGVADSVARITGATGNLTTNTINSRNLALALRADISKVANVSVVDELHTSAGIGGEFIPFEFPCDKSVPLTVKDSADTELTVGTDYEVSNGGIIVIAGGGIDDQGVKLSYTSLGSDVVEMLTNSGKEYELHFDGLNEANSGKAVHIVIHRLKFSPASGMDWLGDDFAELPLEFDLLSDTSIVAAGKSKYAKVTFTN
ncbi:hypothetical protein BGP77_11430 [Saccharospirillum sp. MSK14-1]|uniref:phage tail tube protein n=1 Tax=Saccharospirillum sp. MSK14-1 TaxID=1897632 RepID=UPI000D33CA9B|nr:hypothetical protein [Saccharospirillum sp. MSK14-1]PTY38552.1 hypothetical protein BGP77_11430 [Saccharospirillum sp. MSK14-1]